MLVMPTFLPIIPFIVFAVFAPQGYKGHHADEHDSIPVCHRPFPLFSPRMRNEEEVPAVNKPRRACLYVPPNPHKGNSEACLVYISELFFHTLCAYD